MVYSSRRSYSSRGSSRFPIDADGSHGVRPPKSVAEPEVEIDGKVVLFGKSVLKLDATDSASKSTKQTTRSDDDHNDIREPAANEASSTESRSIAVSSWNCFSGGSTTLEEGSQQVSSGPAALGWCVTNLDQPTETAESVDNPVKEDTLTESPLVINTATDTSPSAPAPATETSGWSKMFGWPSPAAQAAQGECDKDKADDESTVDGRLFGDLKSVPSVNGDDVTIGGNSLQSADFDGRDDQSHVRSGVDHKLHEIVVNKDAPVQLDHHGTSRPRSGADEMSVSNRRHMLIKELRSAIATFGRYDLRCADISAALGDLLNETREHDQAVKLHKDSVSIYSVKLGDDHATTVSAKLRLANVLADANEFDEAVATYYNVISMRRALKGDRDPSVAEALGLMAKCLKRNGEYQQAIKELKRALKIYRESLGDSDENVSRTVDEIASLYVTLGDFEKSAAILEEVVKLKAATQGMQSKAVAETLLSLATTYECSEQFTQAMKSLKKAYKVYTEIDGYSSEDATATLRKIALLYEATGDYNRASIAFLGVLRGQKIHLGEDHLHVGETYCKLGHALRHTGQLDKALKCMKEALPIFVGKGVEMHDVEKIAEIMHEMALIYKEKRHYVEAARIFNQELSVRRKIGQPEYPCIARTLNLLGVTEYEMTNNSRALKFLVESLTIYQQERNGLGVECAEVLYNTGLVFNSVRNGNRALEAFAESRRIFQEQGVPKDDPRLERTEKEIAKIRLTNTRRPR
jgi:tetratricopeptide (TPR) repeat protein